LTTLYITTNGSQGRYGGPTLQKRQAHTCVRMTEQNALLALNAKRAALLREIAELKSQVAWRQKALKHVDATLHLLDPVTYANLARQARGKRSLPRKAKLGRMVMETLRSAAQPLPTSEIVSAVLVAGGHAESVRSSLAPRVRGNLILLQRAGKVAKSGRYKSTQWALAANG